MKPSPSLPPSLTRRVLFALAATVLGTVLFLALLEGGLRLADFGHPLGFILKEKGPDNEAVFTSNPFFIERFLPVRMPPGMTPKAVPFRLAKKAPGTVRVFLLGGSAANGVPDPAFGMARFLEILFSRQYPGVRFEVVNAAVPTFNSNALLPISRAILRDLEPDLLVLYTGNNEVISAYGLRSPVGHSQALVRIHQVLVSSRVGQLVQAMRRKFFNRSPGSPAGRQAFEEALLSAARLSLSDPRLEAIRRLFAQNLGDVIEPAREAGVGVVLGAPGCNLGDNAPFASAPGAGVGGDFIKAMDLAMEESAGLADQGETRKAALVLEAAVKLDPDFAELRYRSGKSWEQAGEYGLALEEYKAARDADALRNRTDSGMLVIIRKAAGPGAALADAERAMEEASPNGIPGDNLFFDHVHMRVSGNYLAARSVFEAARDLLPPEVLEKGPRGRTATLEECLEALPFTDWDRLRQAMTMERGLEGLLYRQASDHEERLAAIRLEVRDLSFAAEAPALERAREAYERVLALAGPDASWMVREKYANLLLYGLGQVEEAGRQARKVLDEVESPESLSILAVVENEQGRHQEAVEILSRLAELRPDDLAIRVQLLASRAVATEKAGRRLLESGRVEEGREKLEEAARLRQTLEGYGVVLPGGGP
ncbi:MAG: tetratricopeptide repeat protein [Proteobacteria bacterium]|nr:tetratricopeptide repeat protein [Pseudomonadota bacterium]